MEDCKILLSSNNYSDEFYPEIDIVVTFFNHQKIVRLVLDGIISNIGCLVNLIIIDDCSEDKTVKVVRKFLKSLKTHSQDSNSQVISYILIKNLTSKFESASANLATNFALTNRIIYIQGDQLIRHKNFDQRMLDIINKNPRIFCVSGRGIHRFIDLKIEFNEYYSESKYLANLKRWKFEVFIFRNYIRQKLILKQKNIQPIPALCEKDFDTVFRTNGTAGFLDSEVFGEKNIKNFLNNKFFIGQTVMRGPVIYRIEDLYSLNYFNEEAFFLKFDDHELNLKARLVLGKACAYIPVNSIDVYQEGATRKARSYIQFRSMLINKRTKYSYLQKSLLRSEMLLLDHAFTADESIVEIYE